VSGTKKKGERQTRGKEHQRVKWGGKKRIEKSKKGRVQTSRVKTEQGDHLPKVQREGHILPKDDTGRGKQTIVEQGLAPKKGNKTRPSEDK